MARRGLSTAARWCSDPPTQRFRALVFISAIAVLLFGLWQHQMWRDEMQAWLIVRDSHGIANLFHNLRFEGHPALWYLLLSVFSALGRQPYWMQVAQGGIASATLAIILWRGPFSRLEMLLLPFGYCLMFEYGVKSRSYALGNLLLVIFCASWRWRRERPMLLGLILALLANVHALFTIISGAAAVALVVDRLVSEPRRRWPSGKDALAAGVFLLGVAAAVATARPPPDSGFAEGWHFHFDLERARMAAEALRAIVYETSTRGRLALYGLSALAAIGGTLPLVIGLLRWRRAPAATAFLVVGAAGLVAFFYVKYGPFPWHRGLLFIVLIGGIWLAREARTGAADWLPPALFGVILAVQALHGLASVGVETWRPYSNGHAIARLIERKGWPDTTVMALEDSIASTVVGYLGAESFYYAPGARRGSFIIWDRARLAPIDVNAFFQRADATNPAPTVLDCGPGRYARLPSSRGYVAVAAFDGSIIDEDCIVYRRAH